MPIKQSIEVTARGKKMPVLRASIRGIPLSHYTLGSNILWIESDLNFGTTFATVFGKRKLRLLRDMLVRICQEEGI